jgi:hypothetical protein
MYSRVPRLVEHQIMLQELKGEERKKKSTVEEERMIKRDETPQLGSDESQR